MKIEAHTGTRYKANVTVSPLHGSMTPINSRKRHMLCPQHAWEYGGSEEFLSQMAALPHMRVDN
jgi:hypothetical protein